MDILNQKKVKSSLPNDNYMKLLGLGKIDGSVAITKFGRTTVTDSEKIVSENGVYGLPTLAENVIITSTDLVNDVPGGDGAREVSLLGIDENDLLAWETLIIDQQSVNSYKRVFRVAVTKSGTISPTGVNANLGVLTVEQSTSGIEMVKVPVNQGQTQCACLTIPKGYTALVHYADTVNGEGKQANNKLKVRANYNDPESPFLNKGERDNFENLVGRKFVVPTEITEMSDVIFTSISNASGADVSAVIVIELVENSKNGL